MTTATIPDLQGFETYFGLQVSDVGEDGSVIILGHHHNEPRRIVAALNRHAREFWGLANLVDDQNPGPGELADSLAETYAVARCGAACRDDQCGNCERVRAGQREWWITWDVAPGTPHSFPATVWRP
ncbi:hypothetical protein [Paractinoplanes toevensis]|uniref:Uncharacterized protein n=1 Tax=Paractinoplanes toevensis TaxID=571911 RepID=A0A919T5L7_9ACTN|nr:hypothetical protein [Actinoplanes toevensis]GIM88797.1 hypothetical protein Ato02nite_005900 [Actinoplanes toevensis]